MTPITADFRPRLRPTIQARPHADGQTYLLHDSARLTPDVLFVQKGALPLLSAWNGQQTLGEMAQDQANPAELLRLLMVFVNRLDEVLFLDSPRFTSYLDGPDRLPSCLGCYPEEPAAIREELAKLFLGPGGPGRPMIRTAPGVLRAVFVPHMDYARGGVTYGHGFKELVEHSNAKLFFIIATSHYSGQRFSLTRKNFATPLGVVPTDQRLVNLLEAEYGPGLFNDPYAHLPEHSIELEVLLLQYLLAEQRPFRILPLLVGSFADRVRMQADPGAAHDIGRMVRALQKVEAASGEEVCYIISGDLAHIGPKFGHAQPVDETWLQQSRSQDDQLLEALAQADAQAFFEVIAAEKDERNICGLPPAWLALTACRPDSGRILHYGRAVDPTGHESVSFAAAAFYSDSASAWSAR